MTRNRTATAHLIVVPALLVLAVAMFTASASASTTVGQPYAGIDPLAWQQNVSIAPRRNYDVGGSIYEGFEVGGVLTSISIKTSQNAGNVGVSVLRKTADINANDASFLSVSTTNIPVPEDFSSAGTVTTVPTRIAVAAGDRFAANSSATGTYYLGSLPSVDPVDMNHCFYSFAAHLTGETVDYLSTNCNNFVPLVQGTVEADADGDLYGDETQDLCPTRATIQSACPIVVVCSSPCEPPEPDPLPANLAIAAVKSKAKLGSSATRSFRVKNIGSSAATPVTFSLRASRKVKKFTFVRGCTGVKGGKSCTIPSIAIGTSVTIKVKVTPKASTSTKLTASVNTPGETAISDNSARTSVKFKLKK